MTVLAAQGWGPAALQDHWASQPNIHYDTSAPFMAVYGLFNFYIYILAYLFTPGGGNIHGKRNSLKYTFYKVFLHVYEGFACYKQSKEIKNIFHIKT